MVACSGCFMLRVLAAVLTLSWIFSMDVQRAEGRTSRRISIDHGDRGGRDTLPRRDMRRQRRSMPRQRPQTLFCGSYEAAIPRPHANPGGDSSLTRVKRSQAF
jgi:hypothetical protein